MHKGTGAQKKKKKKKGKRRRKKQEKKSSTKNRCPNRPFFSGEGAGVQISRSLLPKVSWCLCAILEVPVDTCNGVTRGRATLPLSLGGFGLRTAERAKVAACWASWADVLPMIQARHPAVAALIVQHLEGESWSPSMEVASRAATQLEGMAGFAVLQWSDLAGGLRPERQEPEDHEPGSSQAGRTKHPPEWNISGRCVCSRT